MQGMQPEGTTVCSREADDAMDWSHLMSQTTAAQIDVDGMQRLTLHSKRL